MNFEKLNKRITIEKYSSTTTVNGFDIEKWIEYKTVWASVNNLYGKEFWSAKAIQAENTVEFTVRYNKKLEVLNSKDSKDYRINFNNRHFNIEFTDNRKYENKYLKIKAIEIY